MEITLKKWGNSLAIRIPGAYCRQSGMVEGSKVTVSIENGSLVITPVKGVILADQAKNLDWRARNVRLIDKVEDEIINEVVQLFSTLIN